MRLVHLALALSLLIAAAHAADTAETALLRHSDGFSIDDDPKSPALLTGYWQALTKTALATLNGHPGAPVAALVKLLPDDPKGPTITATALGPDLIELDISEGEIGDVLLLTRHDRRFAVVWDAAKLAPQDMQRFPMLAAWSVERAQWSRRVKAPEGQWDRYGPIHGTFLRLPSDRAGHLRLALDATYAQAMGETVAGQISLWSWDGTTMTPLLARSYSYMIEQGAFVGLRGDILSVHEKDEFKSFYSAGSGDGRQLEWTIRIGPDRIEDLGTRSTMPELDALDATIQAMRRGAPVRDLASDDVVHTLKPMVDAAADDARKDHDHFFTLGMLMADEVSEHRDSAVLCFATDNMERPLLIAFKARKSGIFLSHAATSPTETCPK